jgi:hypothetical protein
MQPTASAPVQIWCAAQVSGRRTAQHRPKSADLTRTCAESTASRHDTDGSCRRRGGTRAAFHYFTGLQYLVATVGESGVSAAKTIDEGVAFLQEYARPARPRGRAAGDGVTAIYQRLHSHGLRRYRGLRSGQRQERQWCNCSHCGSISCLRGAAGRLARWFAHFLGRAFRLSVHFTPRTLSNCCRAKSARIAQSGHGPGRSDVSCRRFACIPDEQTA